MNSLVRDHLPATFFTDYQALRGELIATLRDDDLAFRPGRGAMTLGELCREIGEIEHSYVEALRTFRQHFIWRCADHRVQREVEVLATWYADLDRDLLIAIEALTDEDIAHRRIVRQDFDVDDFSPPPAQALDIYREALLIFYAKVSIYLRLMGRELPGHWEHWIG